MKHTDIFLKWKMTGIAERDSKKLKGSRKLSRKKGNMHHEREQMSCKETARQRSNQKQQSGKHNKTLGNNVTHQLRQWEIEKHVKETVKN